MTGTPRIAALIVAAGSGRRAGGELPKQYQPIAGVPMLRRTVQAFVNHPMVSEVRVVISPEHRALYDAAMDGLSLADPIHGGAERQDSVRLGLEALGSTPPSHVLIHDAARPFVTEGLISRVAAALAEHKAVMPTLAVSDTLRQQGQDGWQEHDRTRMVAVQTPQGFEFQTILNAHRALAGAQRTDDIAVVFDYDATIHAHAVTGDAANQKMTTAEDMTLHSARLAVLRTPRVGMGFDVHKLIPGDGTIRIGGIDIAHSHALEGHSDADVALHAITDALLGTVADGDIGAHFSPHDARWKGKDSAAFLEDAARRVHDARGRIAHIDVTILCEAPKIAPHRAAMRERIAAILTLPVTAVSVKATTTESLGFTGRREGIAAQAVATVMFEQSEAA